MSQKLDKEHLNEIQELKQKFTNLSTEIGNITIEREMIKAQLSSITARREELMNQFETMRKQEAELFDKLTDRYGEGSIDIEQGVFIPSN
jgi:regulator of replication initiation timing